MSTTLRTFVALGTLALAAAAGAEDAYYSVPIRDLTVGDATVPGTWERPDWRARQRARAMLPYAELNGEGEVYVNLGEPFRPRAPITQVVERATVAIRAARGQEVNGRLFLPKTDWSGMTMLAFTVPAAAAKDDARSDFDRAKHAHYQELLARGIPGAAWFRHQARMASPVAEGRTADRRQPATVTRNRATELARTYALLTGGRALAENLQLDRVLAETERAEPTVEIRSIKGITVREFDYRELIKDTNPATDPLAAMIPADQHAVFFPTITAALKITDLIRQEGTVLLRAAEPRAENARTIERYEHQLCLPLDDVVRLLGPHLARSVALTGSDPYFRTGTDVAVLIEAPKPALLEKLLVARVQLAAKTTAGSEQVEGQVGSLAYHGVRSADRGVCSYVARQDGAVVVSNSLYQLGRLASVRSGQSASLASLPEYKFFRNRYPLGADNETALLLLSDATIRRWCGPRWRIATSRRTRDMAVVAELQAQHLDRLVHGPAPSGPIYTDLPTAEVGEFTLAASGVRSSVQGTLGFMTPIAELALARVTQAEADVYGRWRDGYQRNWRWAFDPIALRLRAGRDELAADLSVMPLIWGTDYRQFVALSQGAKIEPDAGDPHDALAHVVFSINTSSPLFQQAGNFLTQMARGATLGWLGGSVAVYADRDPFWQELAKVAPDELDKFFRNETARIPVAVRVEVSNGFRLTAFLASLRAFIEQSAPGMTVWESLTYQDEPYVKVTPSERAKGRGQELENLAVYYCASGESLLVTLSEDLLKRALDRRLDRHAAANEGQQTAAAAKPWLGTNVGLHADGEVLEILAGLGGQQYQAMMQARAWGNLPILNEWKRRYPDEDPVALHQRVWHIRLVCPGGGDYVWNDPWRTMESTVYGHPGQPKQGPRIPPMLKSFTSGDFGLSFEDQSLRATVVLERNSRK